MRGRFAAAACLVLTMRAAAHIVRHDVGGGGISVKVFYSDRDPAAYAEYEVSGPGDKEPHAVGRTDRHGIVCFLPDRPGRWTVKVLGESSHGFHGATVDVDVGPDLAVVRFSKAPAAGPAGAVAGVGLILALFGAWSLWAARRRGEIKSRRMK